MKDNIYLGTEKISKLMFKFSIPCILSLLISSIYNIVDQIYIGHSSLGYLGNAATSIVFPITVIAVAFAWCFGNGASAYLSLCQGRGDTENAHRAIGNSILINFVLSILFLVFGTIFADDLLYAFGASDLTIDIAKDYFLINILFLPIFMTSNSMNSVIRSDGAPMFSMLTTLAGAILNIILDPIFIFGFDLGIKGAAWATVISQSLSFVLTVFYFTRTKTFKLKKDSFKPDFKLLSSVAKLGISTFITQMSVVVISLVCNSVLAHYGELSKYGADIPIAVIGICMKVFSIVMNVIVGIIMGAQPIIGYNYGAKNYSRVKETYKIAVTFSTIFAIIGTLIFQICPELIINLFGTESELYMEFAVKTFKIFLLAVAFTAITKTSAIFFQAVGEPLKSTILSLFRDIIIFVPLVIILPGYMGIDGALWAAPIADSFAVILTIILVVRFMRGLKPIEETKVDKTVIKSSKPGPIITISREHGSQGKYIGELVAKKLGIPVYYKEITALAAKESGLDKQFVSKINSEKDVMHELYLTTEPVKYAIIAQNEVINMIADQGSCVLVGRAADYVLRQRENLIRIFIHAPKEYKEQKVIEMYKDSLKEAKKNVEKSDKNRASYYKMISGKTWGDAKNYDLCIDSSIGAEKTADIICDYIKSITK